MLLNTRISNGIAVCAVTNVNAAIPSENTKNRKIYAVSKREADAKAIKAFGGDPGEPK